MRPEVTPKLNGVSGWLTSCLVEGDEAHRRGARRTRRKALIVSLTMQFALLALLVLAPLLAGVSMPRPRFYVPIPPYSRGHSRVARSNQLQQAAGNHVSGNRPPYPVPDFNPRPGGRPSSPSEEISGPPDFGIGEGPVHPGVEGGTNPPDLGTRPPEVAPPKRPTPQPAKPVRISEPIQQAMLIHRVEPEYPVIAKQIHQEGTVRLHATIGRDGAVRDLEVLSGPPLLAKAACAAVLQWRYRPTILNGEAVEVDTYITVVFTMHS